MDDTIVTKKPDGTFKATHNGRTIGTGETQNEAGWNGLQKRPNAAVVAQRVRDLGDKHPDQFRRIYPTDRRNNGKGLFSLQNLR